MLLTTLPKKTPEIEAENGQLWSAQPTKSNHPKHMDCCTELRIPPPVHKTAPITMQGAGKEPPTHPSATY